MFHDYIMMTLHASFSSKHSQGAPRELFVDMHNVFSLPGYCEFYISIMALQPRDVTSCFARALMYFDNKPSRTDFNHLSP